MLSSITNMFAAGLLFLGFLHSLEVIAPATAIGASPLTDLTKSRLPDWVEWTERTEEAFQELKRMLCSGAVLIWCGPWECRRPLPEGHPMVSDRPSLLVGAEEEGVWQTGNGDRGEIRGDVLAPPSSLIWRTGGYEMHQETLDS
ncbi:hypothetical protein AAFF_G00343360 [Aldrovandia affinis]|uniref:Uncharacterized protein n=1 Tax=Aldrovandia affinis TaxID=143900 RepID=A0AAD7SM41_9TELE|nr:hypothetical protein AAFF_G00343360 [Aldrovandia affinis]